MENARNNIRSALEKHTGSIYDFVAPYGNYNQNTVDSKVRNLFGLFANHNYDEQKSFEYFARHGISKGTLALDLVVDLLGYNYVCFIDSQLMIYLDFLSEEYRVLKNDSNFNAPSDGFTFDYYDISLSKVNMTDGIFSPSNIRFDAAYFE